MLAQVTTTETYESPRMRKLNHHYRDHLYQGVSGIRAVCMRLYDEGLTYIEIAARVSDETGVSIRVRTLAYYLRRWRAAAQVGEEATE